MIINKIVDSGNFKKERILYIDFLRFSSMFMVFFHHVRAEFYLAKPWVSGIFGIGWGEIGVYTFIILSGYSLYLNKNDKLNFLQFIKKRFLNIIIPYWIFYLSFFFFYLFIGRFDFQSSNMDQVFISLTGIDTFINPFFVISKYCLVDWFLGFIIILYLMAPFLFIIYNKIPYYSLIFFFFVSFITIIACKYDLILRIPVVQIFTFLIGVFAADCVYRNFGKGKIIFSILLFLVTCFVLFFFKNENALVHWIKSIYLSLSFVFFVKISFSASILKKIINFFELLIRFGSEISYVFFLCHHQILFLLKKVFIEKNELLLDYSCLLVVVPFFLTVFVSCFLQLVCRSIVFFVKNKNSLMLYFAWKN